MTPSCGNEAFWVGCEARVQMLPVCRDQRIAATANHLSPSNATPHRPLLSHPLPSCPPSLHPLHLLSALPLGPLPASSNPRILPFDIFIVPHLHNFSLSQSGLPGFVFGVFIRFYTLANKCCPSNMFFILSIDSEHCGTVLCLLSSFHFILADAICFPLLLSC